MMSRSVMMERESNGLLYPYTYLDMESLWKRKMAWEVSEMLDSVPNLAHGCGMKPC
jgi:hypothetical protein